MSDNEKTMIQRRVIMGLGRLLAKVTSKVRHKTFGMQSMAGMFLTVVFIPCGTATAGDVRAEYKEYNSIEGDCVAMGSSTKDSAAEYLLAEGSLYMDSTGWKTDFMAEKSDSAAGGTTSVAGKTDSVVWKTVTDNDGDADLIKSIYRKFVFAIDNDGSDIGNPEKYFTAKALKKLKDNYMFDCNEEPCYAYYALRTEAQDSKPDSTGTSQITGIEPTGDGWYIVSYLDMGWPGKTRIRIVDGKIDDYERIKR